jgi:hypothetical protein
VHKRRRGAAAQDKEATVKADKITLEPTEDGRRWRVRLEGGDVEGHEIRRRFSIEPDGEQDGDPVYRVSADGEDVEGHLMRWSDQELKQAVAQVEDALAALRELETGPAGGEDVEGHASRGWSDRELKQAVAQVEDALAALRELETVPVGADEDVEGHAVRSDERLKQGITALTDALDTLKALGAVRS